MIQIIQSSLYQGRVGLYENSYYLYSDYVINSDNSLAKIDKNKILNFYFSCIVNTKYYFNIQNVNYAYNNLGVQRLSFQFIDNPSGTINREILLAHSIIFIFILNLDFYLFIKIIN